MTFEHWDQFMQETIRSLNSIPAGTDKEQRTKKKPAAEINTIAAGNDDHIKGKCLPQ